MPYDAKYDKYYQWQKTMNQVTPNKVTPKPPATGSRPVGTIWKIHRTLSPFNTIQWQYQGLGKLPYVITHYLSKVDGSVTQDGWACPCPSFTKNAPRTPCKHILNVMLNEGKTPTGASAKAAKTSALMSNDDAKQFEKWKREQAEKGEIKPSAGADLNLWGETGRRFR